MYGWGQPSMLPSNGASTLQMVTTEVVVWNKCKEVLRADARLDVTYMCSDSLQQGISPCNGDAGRPLVKKHANAPTELIGIVSWGYILCGLANMPTIHTRVSAYIDWVSTIQKAYVVIF